MIRQEVRRQCYREEGRKRETIRNRNEDDMNPLGNFGKCISSESKCMHEADKRYSKW
jgi:hypothetical protein